MMMKGGETREREAGGLEAKRKTGEKSDEGRQARQPRYGLDLGFSISISVTERAARRGIKKQNLRDAFHVGPL